MLIFLLPKGDFDNPSDVRIEALFLTYWLGEEVGRAGGSYPQFRRSNPPHSPCPRPTPLRTLSHRCSSLPVVLRHFHFRDPAWLPTRLVVASRRYVNACVGRSVRNAGSDLAPFDPSPVVGRISVRRARQRQSEAHAARRGDHRCRRTSFQARTASVTSSTNSR